MFECQTAVRFQVGLEVGDFHRMKGGISIISMVLLTFSPIVQPAAIAEAPSAVSQPTSFSSELVKGVLLYHDDFTKDLSNWVVEQTPDGTTSIIDAKLDVNDASGPHGKGGCTVWFRNKLSCPILIEYDACLVQEGGPNDRVSDLNCFWMATDPAHPEDFFARSRERGGNFKNYDDLQLYYVGFGANGNTTTRFRRYPRSRDDKGLRPEYDLSEAKFMNLPNKTVKVRILAEDEKVRYYSDDRLVFEFTDPTPYREGWFGFRTVRSHLRISNFRVYRPSYR